MVVCGVYVFAVEFGVRDFAVVCDFGDGFWFLAGEFPTHDVHGVGEVFRGPVSDGERFGVLPFFFGVDVSAEVCDTDGVSGFFGEAEVNQGDMAVFVRGLESGYC